MNSARGVQDGAGAEIQADEFDANLLVDPKNVARPAPDPRKCEVGQEAWIAFYVSNKGEHLLPGIGKLNLLEKNRHVVSAFGGVNYSLSSGLDALA
jgi:hypothetical protein